MSIYSGRSVFSEGPKSPFKGVEVFPARGRSVLTRGRSIFFKRDRSVRSGLSGRGRCGRGRNVLNSHKYRLQCSDKIRLRQCIFKQWFDVILRTQEKRLFKIEKCEILRLLVPTYHRISNKASTSISQRFPTYVDSFFYKKS